MAIIKVYKTMTGAYKETTDNYDVDGFLYTPEEHASCVTRLTNMELELRKVKEESKYAIRQAEARADRDIREAREEAEEQIQSEALITAELRSRIATLENKNKELQRMAIERANRDRNLRPKKQRCGYVLQNHDQLYRRFNTGKRTYEEHLIWRTKLQTPYSAELSYDSVEDSVIEDLKLFLFSYLGLAGASWEMPDVWDECEDKRGYDLLFKLNGPRGYWELEFITLNAITFNPDLLVKKESE